MRHRSHRMPAVWSSFAAVSLPTGCDHAGGSVNAAKLRDKVDLHVRHLCWSIACKSILLRS
jgi:hypothetical protein